MAKKTACSATAKSGLLAKAPNLKLTDAIHFQHPHQTPTPTPTPNVVQFSASNYNVQEDCTTVTITVNRIGNTSGAASVDYSTADVTAIERGD